MTMEAAAKRLQREGFFLRIVWMVLYGLIWQVAAPLLMLTVILQVLYRLFKGRPHAGLMRLGDGLGGLLAQIARFACFQTEDKPWPVADWPASPETADSVTTEEQEA